MRPRPHPLLALAALAACVAAIGGMVGCKKAPDAAAIPQQRPLFTDPSRWQRIVHMDDADAEDHFVAGIASHLDGIWRWGAKNPVLRLRPLIAENLHYVMELAVPEGTFRTTGPVNIAFFVNDHLLDRVRYDRSGTHTFEKAVPAEWLRAGEDAMLSAEIDKVYMDGQIPRGFIIVSLGLRNTTVKEEHH